MKTYVNVSLINKHVLLVKLSKTRKPNYKDDQ